MINASIPTPSHMPVAWLDPLLCAGAEAVPWQMATLVNRLTKHTAFLVGSGHRSPSEFQLRTTGSFTNSKSLSGTCLSGSLANRRFLLHFYSLKFTVGPFCSFRGVLRNLPLLEIAFGCFGQKLPSLFRLFQCQRKLLRCRWIILFLYFPSVHLGQIENDDGHLSSA